MFKTQNIAIDKLVANFFARFIFTNVIRRFQVFC